MRYAYDGAMAVCYACSSAVVFIKICIFFVFMRAVVFNRLHRLFSQTGMTKIYLTNPVFQRWIGKG